MMNARTKDRIMFSAAVVLAGLGGFGAGQFQMQPSASVSPKIIERVSTVELLQFVGDELQVRISGPARVTWSGGKLAEGEGEHAVPLGQIANADDLALADFPYVGNAESGKFYPSDAYHARGTKVESRRYFMTEADALSAGFAKGG